MTTAATVEAAPKVTEKETTSEEKETDVSEIEDCKRLSGSSDDTDCDRKEGDDDNRSLETNNNNNTDTEKEITKECDENVDKSRHMPM